MKWTRFSFMFVVFVFVSLSAYAQASYVSCPVMPGERISKKFFVDYHGERVYLCCRNCVRKFKKHPERYLPEN